MTTAVAAAPHTNPVEPSYDAPELMPIGPAHQVILGLPGGGFDGAYGMTEPPFEFEVDDQD